MDRRSFSTGAAYLFAFPAVLIRPCRRISITIVHDAEPLQRVVRYLKSLRLSPEVIKILRRLVEDGAVVFRPRGRTAGGAVVMALEPSERLHQLVAAIRAGHFGPPILRSSH